MTMEPSREYVEKCLQSAEEALKDAALLLKNNRFKGAINRAYYAMFYAARAALYKKGIKPKTHSGLRAMFSEHFVKPGVIDKESEKSLGKVYDLRQASDYEVYTQFDKSEVKDVVDKAEKFIQKIKSVLSQLT